MKSSHKLVSHGDGFVHSVDESLEHFLGYKTGELVGKPLSHIIPLQFRAAHENAMQEYLETDVKTVMGSWVKASILNAMGEEIPISFVVTESDNEGLVAIFETTDG